MSDKIYISNKDFHKCINLYMDELLTIHYDKFLNEHGITTNNPFGVMKINGLIHRSFDVIDKHKLLLATIKNGLNIIYVEEGKDLVH